MKIGERFLKYSSAPLLAIASSLVVVSCAHVQKNNWLESARKEALNKIDQAQCKAAGGTIKGICMFGMPACVIPFPDAGKECSDKSQCQGMCLLDLSKYDRVPTTGTMASGICQKDTDTCGCTVEILSGVTQPGFCAD